jgi:Lipid A 3-O-deacylase (PagL)
LGCVRVDCRSKKGVSLISCQRTAAYGRLVLLIFFTLLSLGAATGLAQSKTTPDNGDQGPERGHEWEIWTGAGGDPIGTPKVTLGNSVWTVGARYGWVLTDAHGPGLLRGRFEYAVDALPVLVAFQPGGKAYGIGFDPWIMKWNFVTRRLISPYIELGGGLVITTRPVPLGANTFNFTPTGAIGVNLLRGKYHWSIDFRYFHVSDAQITAFNPGTDTFGLRVGFGAFIHAK